MALEEKGQIIKEMIKDVEKELHKRVNEVRSRTGWLEFWMLFMMREDTLNPKIIRQGWTACPIKPMNIEGSMVFYVNVPKGILELERINRRSLNGEDVGLIKTAYSPLDRRAKI